VTGDDIPMRGQDDDRPLPGDEIPMRGQDDDRPLPGGEIPMRGQDDDRPLPGGQIPMRGQDGDRPLPGDEIPMRGPAGGLLVRGLRVERDGRTLLDVGSLEAPAGVCTVVVGAGDSGKTLLTSALSGAVAAAGEVRIGPRVLAGSPSARIRAGLSAVPNAPLRIRGVTVAEALTLAAAAHRKGRRVSDAFDRFPLLAARRRVRTERLSGGEHQALRIACAWIATPAALILDSPTTGLAASVVEAVIQLARDEAARGSAVLWLDQPAAPLPAPAGLHIEGGRISASPA
jgi:branched-chain amino acid transport system ATP-binding protein